MLALCAGLGLAVGLLIALAFGLFTTTKASTTAPARSTAISYPDLLGVTVPTWPHDARCHFAGGVYHAFPGTGADGVVCVAQTRSLRDADIQVTATALAGPLTAPYGIAFRRIGPGNFYVFVVDAEGLAWVGKYVDGKYQQLSGFWAAPKFSSGLNAQNTLRVVVTGSHIACWINGVAVGTIGDTEYAAGQIGLFSGASDLDAAFAHLAVRSL